MKNINFASRPYMYFSEQGNVDDDATVLRYSWFHSIYSLAASCSLQSAVCSLQSAVCSLQSAVCSPRSAVCSLQSAVCGLQSANVIHRLSLGSYHTETHHLHSSLLVLIKTIIVKFLFRPKAFSKAPNRL